MTALSMCGITLPYGGVFGGRYGGVWWGTVLEETSLNNKNNRTRTNIIRFPNSCTKKSAIKSRK